MSILNETDLYFLKCLGFLHSSANLRKGDTVPLQCMVEESIKNKYGVSKDYTDIVQSWLPVQDDNFTTITAFEDSKGSNSDNELELDLLKEDLMCVICNGMDVGARNRLVECSDCHSLYHQECHTPVVTGDSFENWNCSNCKEEASKKVKLSGAGESPSHSSSPKSSSQKQSPSSSYKNSSYSR
ncbi:integrator complex subunit 12 [Diabrotica undecimpunctata]